MASILGSYLPPFEGWLPSWLLFTSLISVANSIQTYQTLHFTARLYNPNKDNTRPPSNISATTPKTPGEIPSQVTPLSSRTFGTWTFLAAIVRLYAAYYVNVGPVYDLAMWAYVTAFVHFLIEWRAFGTTRLGVPLLGPLVVSTVSLAWMWAEKGFYLSL